MTSWRDLRERAHRANLSLGRLGFSRTTFGNASVIDRETGFVAIKPSGVAFELLTPDAMIVTDLEGEVVEGNLRPSSDLLTHLVLYRRMREIGGVVHSHSRFATAFAQARQPIPVLGTTHADYFKGPIPVTRPILSGELGSGYTTAAGNTIADAVIDPLDIPAALLANHGPFVWGADGMDAITNADMLEFVAELAFSTLALAPRADPIGQELLLHHYGRKHGPDASYGQCQDRRPASRAEEI